MLASVLLVSGLLSACGASAGPGETPASIEPSAPSASPAPPGSPAGACTATSLRASGDPWDGAAGSRFAEADIANEGATCVLPVEPVVAIVDLDGVVIAQSAPSAADGGPTLSAGGRIGFTVQLTNWCEQSAALPLKVDLLLAGGTITVDGLAGGTDVLPPCNAPGQPPTISATGWAQ